MISVSKRIWIIVILAIILPLAVSGAVSETDQINSVKAVSDTIDVMSKQTNITESKIRLDVKEAIDDAVLDVRSQVDVQAYQLRKDIDTVEDRVFSEVRNKVDSNVIIEADTVDELEVIVEESLNSIEQTLESKYNAEVDIEEQRRSIKDTLLKYREQIETNRAVIEERGGDLMNEDTDGDGLSDYDEVYIYGTDPENANTGGGDLSDAEKVATGIDPTSSGDKKIDYADPRTDVTAHISKLYAVDRVELVETGAGKRLSFKGTAIPNSYITLYVYSTPIIVTVKTDSRGEWEYFFDKELETGEHDVYVATVNNSGKLIARSDSIKFTSTANSAALGTFSIGDNRAVETDFIQENYVLIVLVILLVAILLTLMLTGGKKRDAEEIMADVNKEGDTEVASEK